ncbi:MAG: cytochrome c biogenesis protein CcsA [Elusimicrobia bacterium]|nr:cytochrome c biogenesis protein CcsA [Elusimicrobiota bacterium]
MRLRRSLIGFVAAGLLMSGAFEGAAAGVTADLEGFGRLPVLQGGRIKPMDTLARTSLLMISGRQSFRVNGAGVAAAEWLLDVMAKPDKADGYRVFAIDDPDVLGLMNIRQAKTKRFSYQEIESFLPEIAAQAQRAQSVDAQARDRFQSAIVNLHDRLLLYQRLKNTLQPEDADDFSREIETYRRILPQGLAALGAHQKKGKGFDLEALQRLGSFVSRYEFLSQFAYFLFLPPVKGSLEEGWADGGSELLKALGPSHAEHPLLRAYARLAHAWKRLDSTAFNAAVAEAGAWWLKRDAAVDGRVRWEFLFNRAQPFYIGMAFYVAAFLTVLVSFMKWPVVLRRTAFHILAVAFVVHTAGLLTRMWFQGRPPVTNLYSSAIFVGWGAVMIGMIVERLYKNGFGSLVASLAGFCTLLVAHHLMDSGDTLEMMRAVLDSNFWLATHVVVITIGYSAMFLAGMLGIVYLLKRLIIPAAKTEQLRPLVSMTYGIICFALLFSFTGTVLGGIWADQSWGRFWGWDPKENGALLIVLWNAVILHSRWGGFIRERGLMVMAVFGNIITSLSWFGVNMLAIGLHSYGFMGKAFYALSAFIVSQFLLMALGWFPAGRFYRLRD